MARSKAYGESVGQREFRRRRRNKVNIRHNSPSGKSKGGRAWVKTRHRVRRRMLGG